MMCSYWRHAYVDEIVYVWSQHDLRLSILTNVDQRRTDLAGAQSCVLCLWFQSFAEKSAAILASIDRAISYIHPVLWRARDSCWLLEYDQAIQLFSMEVSIGDIHAGRPADHQINRFQICRRTVCPGSLRSFLTTSFDESTLEQYFMLFSISLAVQILVRAYPLNINRRVTLL